MSVTVLFIAQCRRLEGGLDKLKDASEQLVQLNVKLEHQNVVVAEKNKACDTLLEDVAANKRIGQ